MRHEPAGGGAALRGVVLAAIALAAVRIAALALSPLNLGPDEAQYWSWSLEPGFGYYSKPPLIAWAIALSTALFGDAEWAVRLPSPIFHAATMVVLFAAARRLGGARAGLWAAALYATIPGVAFAAGLITTDTPLLFFWACALYALIRLREAPSKGWATALGLSLGLAFLAKYAALYFLVGLGLWAASSTEARRTIVNARGAIALGAAALTASPNIVWNALNDWPTAAHTAANAQWRGDLFNADEALRFFGDQFGVLGPLLMAAFLILAAIGMRERDATARFLIAMSVPILLIGLAQAFISRANANWAAPAYVAAILLIAIGIPRRAWVKWAAITSLALHTVAMAGLYAMAARPALADAAGLSNAFKRVRGWDVSVARAMARAADARVDVVIAEDRLVLAELLYYGRDALLPVLAWDQDGVPKHHFELAFAYAPDAGTRAMLITRDPDPADILERFERSSNVDRQTVATGRGKSRTLHLFLLEDPKPAA